VAIFIGILLATIAFASVPLIFEGARRRRIKKRGEIGFDVWLDALKPCGEDQLRIVMNVLRVLSEAIGVPPTHLRPTDRFDRELAMAPPWIGIPNPAIEEFIQGVRAILCEEGVSKPFMFKTRGKTLADLLEHVIGALPGKRGHVADWQEDKQ